MSFLNARPLIAGLAEDRCVCLSLEVPSKLLDGLSRRHYDVALLPVIDYQRMDDLRLLTAGGIGSDGETLTVRIFSSVPIHEIRMLACDTDSHTSVALARILLAEQHGVRPELVPLDRGGAAEALLLIGDKVVCAQPTDREYQIDLGEEWKRLTGLPFVFAAWTARGDAELGDLPARLEASKRRGLSEIDAIVRDYALPIGWPADLARQYLTENLRFDIGKREIQAIEQFHILAAKHQILPQPLKPLRII